MSNDRYRFKLGDFECLAIRDVIGGGGNSGWFPNIPDEISRPILQGIHTNPDDFSHAMTCLAVNVGTAWVLLDTGMGFANEESRLAQILEEENVQPAHIIITHLDLDHYAGLLDNDLKPAFPNARIHICRDAWSLFTSASFYEGANKDEYDRREHLFLIKDQVQFVECDGEILPGFNMIPLPGHRAYHAGIEVASNGEKLLFGSDIVCHPLHLEHLDWHCWADSDHVLARETRVKFAKMASKGGSLVLIYHFEFPGLGHIVQNGDGWKWQPLEL